MIAHRSRGEKRTPLPRQQYSRASNDNGEFYDSHFVTMSENASNRQLWNRKWSTEKATSFQHRGLHQHGSNTALPLKNAQDYFITRKSGFPWSTIPDFVVGRAGVDNWLLVTAMARRAAVVDASRTVTARHQVRSGYQPAAHFTQATRDATINYALAGLSFDYSLGLTDCAPLETAPTAPASTSTGDRRQSIGDCNSPRSVVLRRRPLTRYCRRAYVKLRGLHRLSRQQNNSVRRLITQRKLNN